VLTAKSIVATDIESVELLRTQALLGHIASHSESPIQHLISCQMFVPNPMRHKGSSTVRAKVI